MPRFDNRGRCSPVSSSRTTGNTPVSSPGLFSPNTSRSTPTGIEEDSMTNSTNSLRTHLQPPPIDTTEIAVTYDGLSGKKLINEYEVIRELGRGEHGKVKLARDLRHDKHVAIKIVQRFSKQRRLARLGQPEEKVKKEVAILKKARHPNVVALLEVIDNPKLKKVYIILEYVPLGEIIWRRLGFRAIVEVEKRRLEREKNGFQETPESIEADQEYVNAAVLRYKEQKEKQARRVKLASDEKQLKDKPRLGHPTADANSDDLQIPEPGAWSLELGGEPDDDDSHTISRITSGDETPHASASQDVTSGPDLPRSYSGLSGQLRLAGSMYGPYIQDFGDRHSSTDSSFESQPDSAWMGPDDEESYVPSLTLSEIRNTFRDTVLGLEYLHYHGIIHRDLKPANLLWTADRRTKISDFGVSYLGRPIREDDDEGMPEEELVDAELHDPIELSKTVGTPAFYAPELCYTDQGEEAPKVTGSIDIWALGVTLYCMVFGRIPFTGDTEWHMLQKIVKEDLFLPRKRLKAVEDLPSDLGGTDPPSMNSNKRLPFELAYEDIEEDLADLLKRLLAKDPTKRITLKEVKHHPWVLGELADHVAWVDETDPSRQSAGKKIEVSAQDVAVAVSKVSIIERVASNTKRVFQAVMGGLAGGKTAGSRTRVRASSEATSGAEQSMSGSVSVSSSTASMGGRTGDGKGWSMYGDEAIVQALKASREPEHPLAQSVTASPDLEEWDGGSSSAALGGDTLSTAAATTPRPESHPLERAASTAESVKTLKAPVPFSPLSPLSAFSPLEPPPNTPNLPHPVASPSHLSYPVDLHPASGFGGILGGAGRRIVKGMRSRERRAHSSERSSSVDRGSLHDDDPRAEPSVAVSTAFAAGQVNLPDALQDDLPPPPSPDRRSRFSSGRRSGHRYMYDSTTEAWTQAQEQNIRRQIQEAEDERDASRPQSATSSQEECPPSPDDEVFFQREQGFQHQQQHAQEGTLQTSPPSAATISSSDDAYYSGMSQSMSHPSIPSVVSGATSLSADDYQLRPDQLPLKGISTVPRVLRTGDTVTPQSAIAMEKHYDDDDSGWNGDAEAEDGDYSDEDEGLSIGMSRGKKPFIS